MSSPQNGKRRGTRRIVVALHKWLGLGSVLIVIVIAVTGIVLNHGAELELDSEMMEDRWLLEWYGIAPEGEPEGYACGEHWIVEWSDAWFFDDHSLGGEGPLVGAGMVGDEYVAASAGSLLVLDEEGQVLEKLDEASLPPGEIAKIGLVAENSLALKISDGQAFEMPELLEVRPLREPDKATWFESSTVPEEVRDRVQVAYRGEGLPVSRVVLDLHSGRFFGRAGVIIYDLAAVVLLILAGTGIWLGIRGSRRRN